MVNLGSEKMTSHSREEDKAILAVQAIILTPLNTKL